MELKRSVIAVIYPKESLSSIVVEGFFSRTIEAPAMKITNRLKRDLKNQREIKYNSRLY